LVLVNVYWFFICNDIPFPFEVSRQILIISFPSSVVLNNSPAFAASESLSSLLHFVLLILMVLHVLLLAGHWIYGTTLESYLYAALRTYPIVLSS